MAQDGCQAPLINEHPAQDEHNQNHGLRMNCLECRLNDATRDFVLREHDLIHHIENQNQTIHDFDLANQRDQATLQEFQAYGEHVVAAYLDSEAARVRCEEQRLNLRMENLVVQEALRRETEAHRDTKKILKKQLQTFSHLTAVAVPALNGESVGSHRRELIGEDGRENMEVARLKSSLAAKNAHISYLEGKLRAEHELAELAEESNSV